MSLFIIIVIRKGAVKIKECRWYDANSTDSVHGDRITPRDGATISRGERRREIKQQKEGQKEKSVCPWSIVKFWSAGDAASR